MDKAVVIINEKVGSDKDTFCKMTGVIYNPVFDSWIEAKGL